MHGCTITIYDRNNRLLHLPSCLTSAIVLWWAYLIPICMNKCSL